MSSDNKTGMKRPLKRCLAVFLGFWALLLFLPGRGEGDETGVSLDKAAKAILKVSADEVKRSQIIDMEKERVVESAYADSVPLSPLKIDSLVIHVSKVRKESLRRSFKETNLTNLTKVKGGLVGEGLIPDIPLPLGSELKVGGSEKITFGGRRDYSPERQRVETYRQSAFPDLQMKQELQVNLEGVVAKKVHVFVDQNSKRESDLKNTIRINYQGDEDEVMKSIEAGNTDISLPGTQFVGFSGTHKGLFGIKAQAELGGLALTGIASKEEGKSEKASFVGRSKIDTLDLEDWRFASRQFFHIGLQPGDSLISLGIYLSTQPGASNWEQQRSKGASRGFAFIDPANPDSNPAYSDDWLRSWFAPQINGLDQDYTLLNTSNGLIAMNSPIQDGVALAVTYVFWNNSKGRRDTVGRATPSPPDSMIYLKLLKPKTPDSLSLSESYYHYMLKNIYDLGSRDIGDSLHTRVVRTGTGGNPVEQRTDGVSYAKALGVADDAGWNLAGRGTFLPTQGILLIPFARPFDDSTVVESQAFRNPQIYDLRLSNLSSNYTKFRIEVIYRRKRTSFNLGHTDILKGSEAVTLNGRKLTRDSDYRIDYDTGELTFMSNVQSELERPDSQINVDFDYAPFLALASKSIIGVRGLYKFGEESQLGGTYIARSERTPELRPRLGEEPYRNTMAEMDLTLKSHPEWMTTAMNKLPLVETEAPSNFTFSGEVAQSYPNPNTKGVVFIDDMEGAKASTSLGIQRTDWSAGSMPVGKDTATFDQIYWNNPSAGVKAKEINPNLTGLEGDETRTVLRLHSIPNHGDTSSWGGIMRVVSVSGEDFTQAKLLSVWVKTRGDTADPKWKPKLYVDLGTNMNEDEPWRGENGGLYRDSILRGGYGYWDNEDTLYQGYSPDKDIGIHGGKGDDVFPSNPNPDYFYNLNGTKGNLKIDNEDLTGKQSINTRNEYYQYRFDLRQWDKSPNPRPPGDWQHFVVALSDTSHREGNPDWKRTIYARVWLTGFPAADSVSIAEMEVVGNKWLNDGITKVDTLQPPISTMEKFNVDVINNQENPDYTPPFDPGRDERNRPRREQSLVLRVDSLGRGHRAVTHQALFESQNYTGYRTLTFYVHSVQNASPTFFFRMGGSQSETTNYYEYRIPVTAGTGWQTVTVDLERMTHLKTLIPSDSVGYSYVGEKADGPYYMKVRGFGPSLVDVRRLSLGLENDTLLNAGPISGELWVDELMLESVRKERGTAARASMELQFADLLGIRGDYTYKDSQFHGLTERAGQGFTSSNFGLTSNLSLGKILPNAWGVNLPLSASNIETKSLPRFSAGSDVILSPMESGSKRSLTIDRRADLSFNKTGRGGRWWTRWTVDRWTAQASWSQRKSDTETGADTSRTTNGSFSYNLTPEKKTWTPFKKLKLYYLPSNLSVSTAYSKLIQRSYTKFGGQLSSLYQRNQTGAMQLGYQPIENVDYGLTVNRDLTRNREGGLWERRLGIGIETGRDQRVSTRYSPPVARWLSPNFGYTANYREDHSAQIRTPPDSFDIRNVSMTSNATIGASLSLSTVVRVLTRLRNIGVPKDSVEARDKRILKEGGPWWAFVKLEKLSDRFKILQASFSQDRSSQANGLDRRPSWEYMVGLRDGVAGVPRHRTFYQDQFNRANSFSLSSGATFTAMDIQASYSRQNSKTVAAQSTNISESRKWPDVDVSLSALERLPPLKRLASSASLRSSYAVTKEQSGNGDQGAISKKRTREFSPVASVQMVWKKGMTTTVTVNDRRTVEDRFQGDWPKNVSQSRDFAVQFGYSLAGGIKLFPGKKLKFKSNLDLTSSLTYTITLDSTYLTQSQNQTAYENTNSTSLSFKPTASYNFSSSITGGADAEYTTEKNRKAQLSRKVIGLNVWAQFKF